MSDEIDVAGSVNVQLSPVVSSVTLRQKSAFAIQHLRAAANFSRQCGVIQVENSGKPLGPFYDGQIACVSATVMLCVASLESNINEYLSTPDVLFSDCSSDIQREMSDLIGRLSIIDKYQKVLCAKGIEPFDKGSLPLQDIEILITLRNEFVHFHPEWHDEQQRHERLGRKLVGKFGLSPFIPADQGVVFPQRIVSHGCTTWAVERSLDFMTQFDFKVGLEDKFAKFREKLVG